MVRLKIREADLNNCPEWDELVAKSCEGTIFHTKDWLDIMRDYMGGYLKILECCDIDSSPPRIVGGCALLTHKHFAFRIATDRFERTPYGGIVLASSPSTKKDREEAWRNRIVNSLLVKLRSDYDEVNLVHFPTLIDTRPFIWDGWDCDVKYTYILNVKECDEYSLSYRARRAIKKAINNNISIHRIEDLEPRHITSYWTLESATFDRQQIGRTLPRGVLAMILRMLYQKKRGTLWFAKTSSGEIAAGEIVVYDRRMAHRWSAASHTHLQKTGAVSLLLYEIIKDLREIGGYDKFNLMAANTPQLANFISAFTPQLVPYYSTTKSTMLYRLFTKVPLFPNLLARARPQIEHR
jgi:hypothetical protein